MGKRLLLIFLCVLIGFTLVQTCSVVDQETGNPLSAVAAENRRDILEDDSTGVVARFKFVDGTGDIVSDSNSYCGKDCRTSGLFSYIKNGDIYEISYKKPDDVNFLDSDPSYFTNEPAYMLPFVCTGAGGTFVVLFYLVDANNKSPVFNTNGVSVDIKIPYSAKASQSLTPYYSDLVWATDDDANLETNGKVVFQTDNPDNFQVNTKVSSAFGRQVFIPEIILQKDASSYDPAPTAIVVTAKDQGQPQRTSVLTFSVTIEARENVYPPKFSSSVYSFTIPEEQYTGVLGNVRAEDPEGLTVEYQIADSQGLSLSIDTAGTISLSSPVPTDMLEKKALVLLIKAIEKPIDLSAEIKESEAPFVLILPDPVITITTQTTQSTTSCECTTVTATECTCPTCPTGTVTSQTSCPPCPTATACPSPEQPTTCPDLTTILTTICPQTDCTTTTAQMTTCPATTCECPTSCPTTTTTTSITCEPCPTSCPTTTSITCEPCPTATTPSERTTTDFRTTVTALTTTKCPVDCSQCPATATAGTECPLVCPTTSVPTTNGSCPPCICTTTTETPTTPSPVVEFERQQYSAEVIENVQGYNILTVQATHSDGLAVSYGLDISSTNPANGKFDINSQGVLRTLVPLPPTPKSYLFRVTAFAGGRSDNVPVYIEVISGVNCGDPLFQEVLFTANLKENTKETDFLQVFVANPTNVVYQIAGVFPDSYRDTFAINSTTGYISCIEPIDYEKQHELRITVEARPKSMQRLAEYSLATALVKTEDLNDNKPIFVDPPKVLAYPSGARIDDSVTMPLAKFLARDADSGMNAEVTYSVNSPYFYIDENDGILFAKRNAVECGNDGCDVTVIATDKGSPPLSSEPLTLKVKFISDDFVSVFTVKGSGASEITPSLVAGILTARLGYDIGVLSASPVDSATERIAANEIALSVFATDNGQLVPRDKFKKDFEAIAASIPEFEKKGEIRQPDHGNQPTASSDDLLAATIALSIVLGLVIIGSAAGFLYFFKGDALRRGSSRDRLQSEGESSTSSGEVAVAIMPRVNEKELGASPLPEKSTKQYLEDIPPILPEVKPQPQESTVVITSDDETSGETSSDPPTIQVTDLDQEYMPDSPKPVKSAIKNSMLEDDDEKEKKGGVRFDAEPEVFEIPKRPASPSDLESDVL